MATPAMAMGLVLATTLVTTLVTMLMMVCYGCPSVSGGNISADWGC
jgi:hypothetical protein